VGSAILEPCTFLHESNQTRNSIYVLNWILEEMRKCTSGIEMIAYLE
jgi:hypothetical protein